MCIRLRHQKGSGGCFLSIGSSGNQVVVGALASVGKQGFGCMGMSAFYSSAKTTSEEDCIALFHEAVAAGVTLFNSADFNGPLNADGFGHKTDTN